MFNSKIKSEIVEIHLTLSKLAKSIEEMKDKVSLMECKGRACKCVKTPREKK